MLYTSFSQAQPSHNTYYHYNYSPKEYKSDDFGTGPQNWGIAQDGRGLMYFCNNSGILEFDGLIWRMVSGTQNLDMLKAACGSDGKIYTGGNNELGYLGQSPEMGIQFISLKPLLPDSLQDFGRVFMVKSVGDSIVYLSRHHLFIYSQDQLSFYHSQDRYRRLFSYEGRIILQLAEAGLCEFKGTKLIPLHLNKMPDGRIIRHILGPLSNPILVCNKNGCLHVDNNDLQYHPSVLDTLTLWNGDMLNTISHAIGTSEKGALIVDNKAQLKEVFESDYFLEGYAVISPFFDNHDQLWLATSNGIRHIEYPSQLSYADENAGVKGIPLCIDESDQGLMLGTTEGLYIRSKGAKSFQKVTFENQIESDEFVTDILNIHDDKLILTVHGLYLKNGEKFIRISDVGGYDLEIVNSSQTKLVYGGDEGIVYVNKADGKWMTGLRIDTLSHYIHSVTSQSDQRLWASMFYISKIDISDTGTHITTLDSTHGFDPDMGPIYNFLYQDNVYFCTSMGLYSWDETKLQLERDNLFGEEFGKGSMSNPVVIGDSAIWLSHETGVGQFDLRTKEFLDRDLRRIDYSDVWRIHPTSNGHYWILTTEAVIRYDPSVDNSYQKGFHTLIRGVSTKEDSILFDGYFSSNTGTPSLIQEDSLKPVLAFSHNQVSIKYAATYYNATDKITYSTFLEGQDGHWSNWSDQPFKDYMNLREGQYNFKVKAKNVYGFEGSVASYSFSVQPPWYRTNWAYLFYSICALLGTWGIAVLYSLRLRRQKIQLEGIVKDRTREIAEEKRKSDKLLLNILPRETASELKHQGFATTRSYEEVSVLFSDFVSFSSISEKMTPEELVQEINECFSAFDDILEKEGVEKIKTIGDAYMCASGLNHSSNDPEIDIVRVGIAIREFMKARNKIRLEKGLPYFEIRIGINTGPVVAGVVGKKKFAYDIWGDTVNTASRMESHSKPGELNISASTYEKIKEEFICEYRGMIEAKNKGKLKMYFVRDFVKKQDKRKK
jgi:class 3 adenylate cyclase